MFLAADQWTVAYLSLYTLFMHCMSGNMIYLYIYLYKKPVESKTRTHHGPVGSGRRTAGQRGGAGQGRTRRRSSGTLPLALERIENTFLNDSPEARTV